MPSYQRTAPPSYYYASPPLPRQQLQQQQQQQRSLRTQSPRKKQSSPRSLLNVQFIFDEDQYDFYNSKMVRKPFGSVATPAALSTLQQFESENYHLKKHRNSSNATTTTPCLKDKKGNIIPRIPWSNVSVDSVLGKGGFGCVYRALVVMPEEEPEPAPKPAVIISSTTDTDEHDEPDSSSLEPSCIATATSLSSSSSMATTPATISSSPAYKHSRNSSSAADTPDRFSTNSTDKNTKKNIYALKCLNSKKLADTKHFLMGAMDLFFEAHLLATLDHDNIIRVRGVSALGLAESYDTSDMGYFLLLELLQNDTLYEKLSRWRRQVRIQNNSKVLVAHRRALSAAEIRSERGGSSSQAWSGFKKKLFPRLQKHSSFSSPRSSSLSSTLPSLSSSLSSTPGGGGGGGSSQSLNNKNEIPTLEYRVKNIAMGITSGMKYLHNRKIVLRDLKPENIGFDLITGTVKIFDFGLARPVSKLLQSDNFTATTELAGSLKYMSPETIRQTTKITERDILATDVYSFGILLWELATLQVPFDEDNDIDGIFASRSQFEEHVAIGGWRPSTKSLSYCKPLRQLIQDCWDTNVDARPSFTRIWLVLSDLCQGTNHNSFGSIRLQRKQLPKRNHSFRSFFGGGGGTATTSTPSISSTSKTSTHSVKEQDDEDDDEDDNNNAITTATTTVDSHPIVALRSQATAC